MIVLRQHKRRGGSRQSRPVHARTAWLQPAVAVVAVLFCAVPYRAYTQLPTAPDITHGQVAVSVDGARMQINQASDRAIINWESFNIGVDSGVFVSQPTSTSALLSRVTAANPSQIMGTLEANGIFYLVNPHGIYFGRDAQVNVGSLIATTLNLDDHDFMNRRDRFAGDAEGIITNDGVIDALDSILFAARNVTNNGSLIAPNVTLASGNRVVIDQIAGGKVMFKLRDPAGDAVNNGTIDASGDTGGTVRIQGERAGQFGIVRADGSVADAGEIVIYGETAVVLDSGSETGADAGKVGVGGTVTVFSPGTAIFATNAAISADGGSLSGDGGFVEVSGLENIRIEGSVSAASRDGAPGTFLIDPTSITIVNAAAAEDLVMTGFDPVRPNQAFLANANTIRNTTIVDFLDGTTSGVGVSVTLDTTSAAGGTGNIVQNADAPIAPINGVNNVNLIFRAHGDIEINGGIDASAFGFAVSVELEADLDFSGSGDVDVNAAILTNNGAFTASGVNFNNTAEMNTRAGAVTVTVRGDADIGADITSNVSIAVDALNHIQVTDAVLLSQNGNISLNAGNTDADNVVRTLGTARISAPNGNLTVDAFDVSIRQIDTSGGPGTYGISVTADNDVTVAGPWTTDTTDNVAHNGSVIIEAGRTATVNAAIVSENTVNITAATENVTIADNIHGNTGLDIESTLASVVATAGNLSAGTGDIELDASSQVSLAGEVAAGGAVRIQAAGIDLAMNVESAIDGGSEDIAITATGSILQGGGVIDAHNGGVAITSTSGTVSVVGVRSSGVNQLAGINTSGTQVAVRIHSANTATIGGVAASGAGAGVEVVTDSSGANILLGDITADGTVHFTSDLNNGIAGNILDNNGAAMNVTAGALRASAPDRIGTADSNVLLNPGDPVFDALETAVQNLTVVTANAGANIAIDNSIGDSLTIDAATLSLNEDGTLWLRSTNGINVVAWDIEGGDGIALTSAAGTITIPDEGDLATVGNADIATSGVVRLEAPGGDVSDGSANNVLTIIADKLLFKSGTAESIRTSVGEVDATLSGAGRNLAITEEASGGALTVTDLDGDANALTTNGGDIAATVNDPNSNLTVAGGVAANHVIDANGGSISLNVTPTAGGAGGIVVEDRVVITTDGEETDDFGSVTLSGRISVEGKVHGTTGETVSFAAPAAAIAIGMDTEIHAGSILLSPGAGAGNGVTVEKGAVITPRAGAGQAGDFTINNAAFVTLQETVVADGSVIIGPNVSGAITLNDIAFDNNSDSIGTMIVASADGNAGTFNGDLVLNGTIDGHGGALMFTVDGAVTLGPAGLINNIGALTITAAENIGADGAALDVDAVAIDLATLQANQDIFLTNTPTGNVTAFEAGTNGGNVVYKQTLGNLVVTGNGIVTVDGDLIIDPPADVLVSADIDLGAGRYDQIAGGSYTVADGVDITANGGILITADLLAAGTGIFTQQDDGIGVGGTITSTSGNVTIQAAAIQITDIDAPGQTIYLRALAGDISESVADAAEDARAAHLSLEAVSSIALDTNTASVAARSTGTAASNVITLNDFSGNAAAVDLIDVDVANGSFSLTSNGPVTVTDVRTTSSNNSNDISITTTGTGDVTLGIVRAAGDADITIDIDDGSVRDDGIAGTLVAARNLSIHDNGANTSGSVDVNTAVDSLDILAGGAVTVTEADALLDADIHTTTDGIRLTAGGAITLTATGRLATGVDGTLRVTTADGEISINSAATVTAPGAGGIEFNAAGGLLVGANLSAGSGNVALTADRGTVTVAGIEGGTIAINALGATSDVTLNNQLTASAGDINITADRHINVAGGIAGTNGVASLTARSGDLSLAAPVSAAAVRVHGVGNVTLGGDISATGVDGIDIAADAGVLTMADGTTIHASAGTVTATSAGDLTVSRVISGSAGPAAIVLRTGGDLVDAGDTGGVDLETADGAGVSLIAGSAIGGTDALETAVGMLAAEATDGGIQIRESDGVSLQRVVSKNNSSSIAIEALSGDIDVAIVDAGADGDVTLDALSGSLNAATAGSSMITGDRLTLRAQSGLGSAANGPLRTTATTLDAETSGTGEIAIVETDAVTLERAVTANGAISVSAAGDLEATLAQSLTDAAGNTIALTSTSGRIRDIGRVDGGTQGNVTLHAGNGAVRGASDDATADIFGAAVRISATSGGVGGADAAPHDGVLPIPNVAALDVAAAVSLRVEADGDIAIDHLGDVAVAAVAAGSDDVVLDVDGAINGRGVDGVADISGDTIYIRSHSVGTATPLEVAAATQVNVSSAATGGDLIVHGVGDLRVGTIDAGAGDVALLAGGAILDTLDGNVDVAGSGITLTAAGGIGRGRTNDATDLDIDSDVVTATVTGPGDINIEDANDLIIANIITTDGSVFVQAGRDSGSGTLTVGTIAADQVAGNQVVLTAQDDLVSGNLSGATNIAAGSDVTLSTAAGRIGLLSNPLDIRAGNGIFLESITGLLPSGVYWSVINGDVPGADLDQSVQYLGARRTPPGAIVFDGSLIGGREPQLLNYQLEFGSFGEATQVSHGPAVFQELLPFVHTRLALKDAVRADMIPTDYLGHFSVTGHPLGDKYTNVRSEIDEPYLWKGGGRAE